MLKQIQYFCLQQSTCTQEKFGDTNGVINSHKSKMDGQHTGQKKKDKE